MIENMIILINMNYISYLKYHLFHSIINPKSKIFPKKVKKINAIDSILLIKNYTLFLWLVHSPDYSISNNNYSILLLKTSFSLHKMIDWKHFINIFEQYFKKYFHICEYVVRLYIHIKYEGVKL